MSGKDAHGFQCEFCDKVLASAQSLNHHRVQHTGQDLFRCDVCEKGFPTVQSLRQHKFTHGGLRPHKCEFCEKRFITGGHLKKHTRTHTGERPYECDACDMRFKQIGDLKRHKEIHEGKTYECNKCDYKTKTSTCLYSHLRTHSDIKPHTCKLCSKQFRKPSILKRHVKAMHNKRRTKTFPCEVCWQMFYNKADVKTHMRTHTGEFECEMCGYRAMDSQSLRKHKASSVHEPRTYHACAECGKNFKTERFFVKHMEMHLKVKKSTCATCYKICESNADLEDHMKVHIKENGNGEEYQQYFQDNPECIVTGSSETSEVLEMKVFEETRESPVQIKDSVHCNKEDILKESHMLVGFSEKENNYEKYDSVTIIMCDKEMENSEKYQTTDKPEILKEEKTENFDAEEKQVEINQTQSFYNGDLLIDRPIEQTDALHSSTSYPVFLLKRNEDGQNSALSVLESSTTIVDSKKIEAEKKDLEYYDLMEESLAPDPSLNNHIRPLFSQCDLVLNPYNSLDCNKCEFIAETSGSLIQHKKMKHKGIAFPCVLCDFAGENFDGLYEHIESVHL